MIKKSTLNFAILPATVFFTGASVLIIEVVALRVLSPFFGSSMYTVSSVISVVLAALSLGYYLGGKLSDKYPSYSVFFYLIHASGVMLLLFHLIGALLLPTLSEYLSISFGPLLASVLLFFFPGLLLGMLSPYAVKLQSASYPSRGIGSIAGLISFWSTFGSIVGSISAGFYLIPTFGINEIIIGNSVALFLFGLGPLIVLGIRMRYYVTTILVFTFLFLLSWQIVLQHPSSALYQEDGLYSELTIIDRMYQDRPTRFLTQDQSSSGAMFLDATNPTDLAYDYTRYYAAYQVFHPDVQNALVIGGGVNSISEALHYELPDARIDISEIEPSLPGLAEKYFSLTPSDNIVYYKGDGRRMLQDSETQYDLIFSDVYYSLYSVPGHFTTREFFELTTERLSKNGLFLANMIGNLSENKHSLLLSEIKTMQSVFPNVYAFLVHSDDVSRNQNIILAGHMSETRIDFSDLDDLPDLDISKMLSDTVFDLETLDLSSYIVLTDNFAPVEFLTAKILQNK